MASATRHAIPIVFGSRAGFFGDGGSNGAISGQTKSKITAGVHFDFMFGSRFGFLTRTD